MELITESYLTKTAVSRYCASYEGGGHSNRRTAKQLSTIKILEGINENISLEDAKNLLPHAWLWDFYPCDVCQEKVPTVKYGEDDYESTAHCICAKCLRESADQLESAIVTEGVPA